jgi:hypothetical protein
LSDEPTLIDSIVLFIDSLGSTDAAVGNGAERRLIQLSAAVRRAHEVALWGSEVDRPAGFEVASFTDNLVVGFPIRPGDDIESVYSQALTTASMYQLALALEGVFVRGGLARGGLWMDDLMVYGPGLISAYRLEVDHAVYPRIILHDDVAELASTHVHQYYGGDFSRSPQGKSLLFGWDNRCLVNYLSAFEVMGSVEENAHLHKLAVQAQLVETRGIPRVHEKFVWLANYHNHFCESRGLEDFMIGKSYRHLDFFGFGEWRLAQP